MSVLVICAVALLASALTFFSGFGLGTLLLPAFALFFPVEQAVMLTAVVHLLNGLFKLVLVGRHAVPRIVLAFGLPAVAASWAGAFLLLRLSDFGPLARYLLFGKEVLVMPAQFVIGLVLLLFSLAEFHPKFRQFSISQRFVPLGGLLSGFFGGLSGMQGALRSAFLAKAGLSKEAFIATGTAVACLIDVSRLSVYASQFLAASAQLNYWVLVAAVVSAFIGAALGKRYLHSIAMRSIQRVVGTMLFAVSIGLISGVLNPR